MAIGSSGHFKPQIHIGNARYQVFINIIVESRGRYSVGLKTEWKCVDNNIRRDAILNKTGNIKQKVRRKAFKLQNPMREIHNRVVLKNCVLCNIPVCYLALIEFCASIAYSLLSGLRTIKFKLKVRTDTWCVAAVTAYRTDGLALEFITHIVHGAGGIVQAACAFP
jgi:hypothetical protein